MKRPQEVETFLALFDRVRQECHDNPSRVDWLCANSDSFAKACDELDLAAHVFRMAERSRRELFAHDVAGDFNSAWRDFEERYAWPVDRVRRIFADSPYETSVPPEISERWENADEEAEIGVSSLEEALEFSEETTRNRDETGECRFSHGEWQRIDGVHYWGDLTIGGVDARGVLRRRKLIPFVHLPTPVSASSLGGTNFFFSLLREAQEAFVMGLFIACLAMIRANIEAVLVVVFSADGRNGLAKNFSRYSPALGDSVNRDALYEAINRANSVLHSNAKSAKFFSLQQREQEIVLLEFLYSLRGLIESVGAARPSDG